MSVSASDWQTTREFKFGATIGACVMTSAAAAWTFISLANQGRTGILPYVFCGAGFLAILALAIRRFIAIARQASPRATSEALRAESARRGRRSGLLFMLVFGLEIVLIAGAAATLTSLGRPLLIPIAVAAIFGLHLIPLGRIFSMPVYGVSGVVIAGLAALSLALPDAQMRILALSLSTAIVLSLCALRILVSYAN